MEYKVILILIVLLVIGAAYGVYLLLITKKLDKAAEEAERVVLEDKFASPETAAKVKETIKLVKKSHHKAHKPGVPRQY